jgi:LysM repeat protein
MENKKVMQGECMNSENEVGRRNFKPSFLMLVVLGIHVAAAASFMMMSGCQTKRSAYEGEDVTSAPPPPVMPPLAGDAAPLVVPTRPAMRPPAPVQPLSDLSDASTYVVQKGDSLSKIAAKAGVSTAELAELNRITNRDNIRIGQRILLPSHAKSLPSAPVSTTEAAKPAAASRPAGPAVDSGETHTVVVGDSLGKLAKRYGTTSAAIRDVNNLKSDVIKIGQKLKIPSGSGAAASASAPAPVSAAPEPAPAPEPVVESIPEPPPAPEAVPLPVTEVIPAAPEITDTISDVDGEAPFPYAIKDGETLESVAMKFGVRKEVIMQLNNMTGESLSPGQKILIPWQ